jgi:hypothetical protein
MWGEDGKMACDRHAPKQILETSSCFQMLQMVVQIFVEHKNIIKETYDKFLKV